MQWKLSDAENHFSELAQSALSDGPQEVLCRAGSIIVVARTEYEQMTGKPLEFKKDFKTTLLQGPGIKDLDLARDNSPGREIML